MKPLQCISILGMMLVVLGCTKFQMEEARPAVQIETGKAEKTGNRIIVTGALKQVGDGADIFGHIWSNQTPRVTFVDGCSECDVKTAGDRFQTESFSSDLILTVANTRYYYRAFMQDVHGFKWYGAVDSIDTGNEPFADFQVRYENGADTFCYAPCTVTFTNLSGNYANFEWDFGDGSSDNSTTNPLHFYNLGRPGDLPYQAILKVRNEAGEEVTHTLPINIRTFRKEFNPMASFGTPVDCFELSDGGFLIAGSQLSLSSKEIYVLITDRFGEIRESQPFPVNRLEAVSGFIRLSDGSYAMTGTVLGSGTTATVVERNMLFFRFEISNLATSPVITALNSSPRALHPPQNQTLDDQATGIIELQAFGSNNRHLILTGTRKDVSTPGDQDDLLLLKLSADFSGLHGTPLEITTPEIERQQYVIKATDHEAIITGSVNDGGNFNAFVTRIDVDLDVKVMPFEFYGGAGEEIIRGGYKDGTGNYLLGGYRTAGASAVDRDFYFLSVDENGSSSGSAISPLISGGQDDIFALIPVAGGEFVIAGQKSAQPALMRYTRAGSPKWPAVRTFGTGDGTLINLIRTRDDGLLAVGQQNGQLLLIKTDADGNSR